MIFYDLEYYNGIRSLKWHQFQVFAPLQTVTTVLCETLPFEMNIADFWRIQFNSIQVKLKAYTNQMTSTSMILNNFGTYIGIQMY